MDLRDKRLAVMVPDHPIEYASYEGIIPPEFKGSGAVVIWDHGTYMGLAGNLQSGRWLIRLSGQKLCGEFLLTRLKGGGSKDWLLIKRDDGQAIFEWRITSELKPGVRERLQVKRPPCQDGKSRFESR
jgi:bifunctional non-homologous end joining protein LigD